MLHMYETYTCIDVNVHSSNAFEHLHITLRVSVHGCILRMHAASGGFGVGNNMTPRTTPL